MAKHFALVIVVAFSMSARVCAQGRGASAALASSQAKGEAGAEKTAASAEKNTSISQLSTSISQATTSVEEKKTSAGEKATSIAEKTKSMERMAGSSWARMAFRMFRMRTLRELANGTKFRLRGGTANLRRARTRTLRWTRFC